MTTMNNFELATKPIWQLGRQYGIEPVYVDGLGVERQVRVPHLQQVLASMGVKASSKKEILDSLAHAVSRTWTQVIDSVVVRYPSDAPFMLALSLPLGNISLEKISLVIQVTDEKGGTRRLSLPGSRGKVTSEKAIRGVKYVQVHFPLSGKFSLGYFRLSVRVKLHSERIVEGRALLIVAPKKCYLPPSPKRAWGISLQLYGLRSHRNWGIGDFRDLEEVMKVAGTRWGVATIGVNPLHIPAVGLTSPYSPSSRLFWNPVYLNLEGVEEWRTSAGLRQKAKSAKFQRRLQQFRESPLVDYEAVGKLKWTILEELFRVFRRHHLQPKHPTARGKAFTRFVYGFNPHLTMFCTFQALTERLGTVAWRTWPNSFRHPQSPDVEVFQRAHATRIQFYQYVQWLCELQLQNLDHVAKKHALSFRLYHDLPVGIHPEGADAWVFQGQLASDITVGAPPDSFNLNGQSWGLVVPNPVRLREDGYRFLRETFRQNMRHGGVLRIDHALGLFRMFWVPQGGTGKDGVYVKSYVDEILAVLALESVRRKVMVVGEDLGAVTPVIREKLDAAGLLSYRLLFFEREHGGEMTPPHAYPEQALVAATTHDLPTLKGFWVGRDIMIKQAGGVYLRKKDCKQDRQQRAEDRKQLWEALHREGLCSTEPIPPNLSDDMLQAMYRYLARTPSRLLIVQLEDLLAELDTPNLPGAPESVYPSWRVRIGRDLTAWLNDPAILRFTKAMQRERRKGGRGHQIGRE
ncbi:4-alpha-glucanotransferase [Candidatus Nitrospira neomarina]|uniref:4-alpha-glucanotransferase n=1 Tax=Candidatus Nitrospira neomarina TaxID=3020899 RepID=A0AA96GM78_9BACT|nr:4-alpha-glucanotransferase [Candidatus Nitrospira neomarina]WNM62915.1 4-alpha-glucanotransferase [Candidatus Nitrospira neomarina]